jgi:glycosyltransferase involved in cell wall biosynthesis
MQDADSGRAALLALRPLSNVSTFPTFSSLMVSIIIPNYNGAHFLREAIDSALSQEDVEVEVIVVDDGSTDDSRAIIASYGDRIRVVYQQNKGACAARNAGLVGADGEYIKFLDSDDILMPNVLAEQLAQASALSADSRKFIVYGNAIVIDEDGAVLTQCYVEDIADGTEATAEEMIRRSPLTSMPLHRTSYLREIGGFDARIPAGQEYDLHLRLYFSGVKFIYKSTVCYQYRQHESDCRISTKRHSVKSFEMRYAAYQRHLVLADHFFEHVLPDSVKTAFAHVFWDTGRFAVRCKQFVVARHYFATAGELAPAVCISGDLSYRVLCRVMGPVVAERIAACCRAFSLAVGRSCVK